jgi:hypothetical protein
MTDFEKRLHKAIERGQRAGDARAQAEAERAVNEQELRRLHTQYRIELSEHIERCLRSISQNLPGFRFETIVSERGWGAAVSRDDFVADRAHRRGNSFSRLEALVRPLSSYFVLEVAAKATIRNKECFNRSHYHRLAETDLACFTNMIDLWALEFAELYAAKT